MVGHKLTVQKAASNPEAFKAAMLSRLTPKARKDKELTDAFIASAWEHLQNDLDIIVSFVL